MEKFLILIYFFGGLAVVGVGILYAFVCFEKTKMAKRFFSLMYNFFS